MMFGKGKSLGLKSMGYVAIMFMASTVFAQTEAPSKCSKLSNKQSSTLSDVEVVIAKLKPSCLGNQDLDFKLNVDKMKKGQNFYSADIVDPDKLKKNYPDFKVVDISNSLPNGKYAWASKHAYIVDVSPSLLDIDFLNSVDFNEKTSVDTKMTVDEQDSSLLTFTRKGMSIGPISFDDTSSTSQIFHHDFRTGAGTIEAGLLEKIVKLNPELGDAVPEIVTISKSVKSSDKRGKGGGSLTMIYKVGKDSSLFVNYSFAALGISWLESCAAAPAVRKFSPGEAGTIVKLTRKFLQQKSGKVTSEKEESSSDNGQDEADAE